MDQLKILYATADQSSYTFQTREYFKQVLARQPDVHVRFIQGGDVRKILKEIHFIPDFIYIDDFKYHYKRNNLPLLDGVDIPKGIMHTDTYSLKDKFIQFVERHHIDLIFSKYRNAFHWTYPQYRKKMRWLPQHVNIEVFKDYNIERHTNFLLMGSIKKRRYPLRHKMAKQMIHVEGFVRHPHVGYRHFTEEEKKSALINENYVREINKAKMFLTDDSIHKFPVPKYFEVPACKTLLLAPGSDELRDLGFIDQETFVEINENNYLEKAKYYLKESQERIKIAKQGYDMVRSRHTTQIRVRQFIDYISAYLNGR